MKRLYFSHIKHCLKDLRRITTFSGLNWSLFFCADVVTALEQSSHCVWGVLLVCVCVCVCVCVYVVCVCVLYMCMHQQSELTKLSVGSHFLCWVPVEADSSQPGSVGAA